VTHGVADDALFVAGGYEDEEAGGRIALRLALRRRQPSYAQRGAVGDVSDDEQLYRRDKDAERDIYRLVSWVLLAGATPRHCKSLADFPFCIEALSNRRRSVE
jgi:hypothetical protein